MTKLQDLKEIEVAVGDFKEWRYQLGLDGLKLNDRFRILNEPENVGKVWVVSRAPFRIDPESGLESIVGTLRAIEAFVVIGQTL